MRYWKYGIEFSGQLNLGKKLFLKILLLASWVVLDCKEIY